ncbi:GNAT family N-acetyltransferase [Flavobacterium branchiophilum]|nr:GNAT family N-acetyltransferase [Flavobacterium branchiophilum]
MLSVFEHAVLDISTHFYSKNQLKIWASSMNNTSKWHQIIEQQVVLLAYEHENVLGFVTLDHPTTIDLLYVLPRFQRQGVATQLFVAIEQIIL